MAGHSKWANIKHRKAAVDKVRGRAWSKCARAIMSAARQGGSNPETNLALRYAIDEARYENMPKDTIERAVKKGAGELEGQAYENCRYEGYAPGGVAVIVDSLTDNRTRTAGDMRLIFGKHGGNMGASGCVAYLFDQRGVIMLSADQAPSEDRLMEIAIDAGAIDVERVSDAWVVTTAPADFQSVKDSLEKAGVPIASASLAMLPQNTVAVSRDNAAQVAKLLDALEEHDDIQKVYSNADLPADAG